jgi:hypothetical protein
VVTANLSRRDFPNPPDAAVCVIAIHSMAAKYRSVAAALRHCDTRTTSNGGMFLLVGGQCAHLLAWSLVSKRVNCWQGGHQSALKYRLLTVQLCTTFSIMASKFVVEEPCKLGTARCNPGIWAQWHVCDAAWTVVLGGKGGGGDGPRLPGILTGLPCQGAVAALMVAIALSSTLMTATWQLSDTEHTLCLYLHPGHRPRRPKLMQAPTFPFLSRANSTFPCVYKSWIVNAGYSRLNDTTTFWQSGGIEALEVVCGSAAVGRSVWVVAGIGAPGLLMVGP